MTVAYLLNVVHLSLFWQSYNLLADGFPSYDLDSPCPHHVVNSVETEGSYVST